jgi:hypothetical protein
MDRCVVDPRTLSKRAVMVEQGVVPSESFLMLGSEMVSALPVGRNCLIATVVALAAGAAHAGPPEAIATYQIDGGAVVTHVITGTQLPNGNVTFAKTVTLGPRKVIWNYSCDLDPEGNAVMNGFTTFDNSNSLAAGVKTTFSVPICPGVQGTDNLIGGISSVKLVCTTDGGALTCGSADEYLLGATSNDELAYGVYWCPFVMTKTGQGTTTTNLQFGTPVPSAPGPYNISSLGQNTNFFITGGEKVTFNLFYGANGPNQLESSGNCLGDVNGDGWVNQTDLLSILGLWGATVACGNPADINGDLVINNADLVAVIGSWGECPPVDA